MDKKLQRAQVKTNNSHVINVEPNLLYIIMHRHKCIHLQLHSQNYKIVATAWEPNLWRRDFIHDNFHLKSFFTIQHRQNAWNEFDIGMKWNGNSNQNQNSKLIIKYQIETSLAEAYCIHAKDLTALCQTRDTDESNLTWREHVKGSRHQRLDRSTWVHHVRAPQSFWINRKRGAHLHES